MKQILKFSSLVVLFITSIAFAQDMSNDAKKAYNEGNKYLKSGDYEKAVKNYNEALTFGKDYRIYYQLGITLKKQGKLKEAEQAFKDAIQVNQSFDIAYNGLGSTYFQNGEYAEAAEAFKKFEQLTKQKSSKEQAKDNVSLALVKLAESSKKDGNYAKAVEYLNESLTFNQSDAAYILLATTHYESGEYDKALSATESVINMKTSRLKGAAYYYKAMAFKQKQDLNQAKENFMLAQKDPQYKKLADYELKLLK